MPMIWMKMYFETEVPPFSGFTWLQAASVASAKEVVRHRADQPGKLP